MRKELLGDVRDEWKDDGEVGSKLLKMASVIFMVCPNMVI
jgi:hypothetical protein